MMKRDMYEVLFSLSFAINLILILGFAIYIAISGAC